MSPNADPSQERAVFRMTDSKQKIILGVDTHKHFHHGAVVTVLGEKVADRRFDATPAGYEQLIGWTLSFGTVLRAGVEGTGSYGAGLTGRLRRHGIDVIDVIAPDKQERRLHGKTDQLDAYSAARAVLSQRARTIPKTRDGDVEALRVLQTTRRLLVKQRTGTMNQIKGLLVSAPEALRVRLTGLTGKKLALACQKLRDRRTDDTVTTATVDMLRSLGRRYLESKTEADRIEKTMKGLVESYAPELLELHGIGPDVAAALLVVTGENVDRLTSESALAHLAGTAPIPASSGKTNRYRLNRGGNRHGNAAFHRIVLVRMKTHQPTRDYVAKTLARGKTKRDAMRLLKRYLAREIYPILIAIRQRHTNTQIAA
ncbi:MAG: IS110 family transposase [Leifsonia sp.]